MYTVVATTEDAPFVVTAVGPPATRSRIRIQPGAKSKPYDSSSGQYALCRPSKDPAITIHTDRADQPTLSLSVLLLPEGV